MMKYMLNKLAAQARQPGALQKYGDLPAALGGCELILRRSGFYEEFGNIPEMR
ncbi:hypothetical protein [Oryzomonas rubra]|uniref:hypothetical protein n=1 Tax=Oryzomonas rubra TaxID=2509454 RepID=UPI00165DE293|nr:hypothetical protein [Oryzomonas rubra]